MKKPVYTLHHEEIRSAATLQPNREQLCRKLDVAHWAADQFVLDYTEKMQYPVQLITSLVYRVEKAVDPISHKANLETLCRTLKETDDILQELVKALESAKPV